MRRATVSSNDGPLRCGLTMLLRQSCPASPERGQQLEKIPSPTSARNGVHPYGPFLLTVYVRRRKPRTIQPMQRPKTSSASGGRTVAEKLPDVRFGPIADIPHR